MPTFLDYTLWLQPWESVLLDMSIPCRVAAIELSTRNLLGWKYIHSSSVSTGRKRFVVCAQCLPSCHLLIHPGANIHYYSCEYTA